MSLYLPDPSDVASLALRANLRNPHRQARQAISAKIAHPPTDWPRRSILTVPGLVWSVASDTCATGRLSAPGNIAYGHDHREFVYRQPTNESELANIMSADSEEVHSCYRFDGLSQWTPETLDAWTNDMDVVAGYVSCTLNANPERDIAEGLSAYETYLASPDFNEYLSALRDYLIKN